MKKSLKTVLSASMAALCVFGFGMSANAYELNPEVKDVTPALREASTVGVWTAENPAMKNAQRCCPRHDLRYHFQRHKS